jgi:hypothetical protein
MNSQCEQILKYLKTGKAITPLEALEKFGCFRLAARIDELRKRGYSINTHKLKVGKKLVGSYRMALRKTA